MITKILILEKFIIIMLFMIFGTLDIVNNRFKDIQISKAKSVISYICVVGEFIAFVLALYTHNISVTCLSAANIVILLFNGRIERHFRDKICRY